jgi:hypothetical protein
MIFIYFMAGYISILLIFLLAIIKQAAFVRPDTSPNGPVCRRDQFGVYVLYGWDLKRPGGLTPGRFAGVDLMTRARSELVRGFAVS